MSRLVSFLFLPLAFTLALETGCKGGKDGAGQETGTSTDPDDQDGDGYTSDEDCNDLDPQTNPGVSESCDGLDNNCDDEIDEGLEFAQYRDVDEDGFGDPGESTSSCFALDGYVPNDDDCDDDADTVYLGSDELCDGLDNDCDGEIDENAQSGDTETWYPDADGDGYGDLSDPIEACGTPEGYSLSHDDCDDADDAIHPNADELCDELDNDCDGEVDDDPVDISTWYSDLDGDGFGDPATEVRSCTQPDGSITDGTDCDDDHAEANPAGDEVCDGLDNDCEGTVDEDAADASIWYADSDSDAWGDAEDLARACEAPAGYIAQVGDCDDAASAINPDATEVCDSLDNDCDGSVDSGAVDASTWYADADADAYGDPSAAVASCSVPSGYVSDATDCDDADNTAYPGASEYCDEVDDDCDGTVDEKAVDRVNYYLDSDSDGYGDSANKKKSCSLPAGYSADKTDCDDGDATVHPGADEICDDQDNDCDATVDEDAVDAPTWYKDVDSDAYGDPDKTKTACDKPSGYVSLDTDCNDADDAVHPGASEYCDDEDDDCDGTVDEDAVDASKYYADVDGDAYGDPSDKVLSCDKPTGYVSNKKDCNDADVRIYTGATEYCDGLDNDCDSTVDESAVDRLTFYADDDGDGYGDASSKTKACGAPSGYVPDDTDCEDDDSAIHPGADELCNSEDDDCDGRTDEDAIDMLTWYKDSDRDGYGDLSTTSDSCTMPSGYSSSSADCDDDARSIYPGADEVCEDGIDQDCDSDDSTCGPVGDLDLSSADARLIGERKFDYSGASLSGAGDVDGDGLDDLFIGAYGDDTTDTYSGAAYLVLSPASGDLDLSDADAKILGEEGDDKAGYSVAPAGDVDADGFDDLLIGAIGESTGGTYAGASYLVVGPLVGTLNLSHADAKITASAANDNMGYALAGAGDLNSDGEGDVVVSAYQEDSGGRSAGAVYVFYGDMSGTSGVSAADGTFTGETAYDFAGFALDNAGDVDGDGVPDVLIGAYGEDSGASSAGAAYLIYGPASGDVDLADADVKRKGMSANDYAGAAVAGAGDVDDDGYADIAVGAYGYDIGTAGEVGAAYLLYGPLTGNKSLSLADARLTGEVTGDRAGWSVSGAGDVDGDGTSDLLIGAYKEDSGGADAGASYLLIESPSGSVSLSAARATLTGEAAGDYNGWDVAGAGDADGDGSGDILVGAWKNDTGAGDAGLSYLVYGGAR